MCRLSRTASVLLSAIARDSPEVELQEYHVPHSAHLQYTYFHNWQSKRQNLQTLATELHLDKFRFGIIPGSGDTGRLACTSRYGAHSVITSCLAVSDAKKWQKSFHRLEPFWKWIVETKMHSRDVFSYFKWCKDWCTLYTRVSILTKWHPVYISCAT